MALTLLIGGCSKTYYSTMEKMGFHKRDILVDRVENARDSQADAQKKFKSALEQFGSVVQLRNTDLKKAYDKMESEYNRSQKAAEKVSKRIDDVESVADALFDEWQDELKLFKSAELRRSSKEQLRETKTHYQEMLASMHAAEESMAPVLQTFHDNVLFLKHNLNAQAIGSLGSEFSSLKTDIDELIEKMNAAIAESNAFLTKIGTR